jgi:hypothetical protein
VSPDSVVVRVLLIHADHWMSRDSPWLIGYALDLYGISFGWE